MSRNNDRSARRRRTMLAFAAIAALGAEPMLAVAADNAAPAPQGAAPVAQQPAEASPSPEVPAPAPSFSRAELEKLLAPIALYPDALLAQILPASAYPIEIVQAQRWLDKNKDKVAANDYAWIDQQDFDPAVKALARFPTVIGKMSADLDWTTDLGDAAVNQPQDVADVIQALRLRAESAGVLVTTPQQKVVRTSVDDRSLIGIEPADPATVYVPSYDPVAAYEPPAANVVAPLLAFGTAVAVGALWTSNAWNWRTGAIYPPVWAGYPGWRPPYAGWRPGQPVCPGGRCGNINNGNVNIGNSVNVGNSLKPWRPGSGYRPGMGSKPGIGGARPGGGAGIHRPGGGNTVVGGGNTINVGNGNGNAVNRPGGGNTIGSGNIGNGNVNRPSGGNIGNGNVSRPGGGGANRPATRPAAKPAQRPAQRPNVNRPNMSRPGSSAMGGIKMGAGNAAFANRGAISRAPMARAGGVGRPGGYGGGGRPMGRPGGGGGFHGGGGPRHSDIRLKHDIALVGRLDDGLGYYRFVYNGGHTAYVGVMAQEVQAIAPEAVTRGADGYLRVDYDRLGLPFETYRQWITTGAHLPRVEPLGQ